ncbi:C40 family peptidase [Fodinisporobacter ferrooxydans]|uniref:C40 family peptidase n=1 Tax=Fodinisporobacter ferrooxydans TaxID=2901836 RepID=A0ABY4CPS1_9BACL|nr:C40 family peptidase [Alicyclobacillaceae bacterium MYW30-H2]
MLKKAVISVVSLGLLTLAPGMVNSSFAATTTGLNGALPSGVRMDTSIRPLASRNASEQAKEAAVLKVAQSKLGTPYVWGHNEDRGQFGFDCSNYTAYVYRHALGYKISGASRVQASSVGKPVPKSQVKPGDLLIFDNGGHTGIYAGNNRMIEEGGGLGKVGYLSVAPGSYWNKHLTAVKRMF